MVRKPAADTFKLIHILFNPIKLFVSKFTSKVLFVRRFGVIHYYHHRSFTGNLTNLDIAVSFYKNAFQNSVQKYAFFKLTSFFTIYLLIWSSHRVKPTHFQT